jgi:hypothetical protein
MLGAINVERDADGLALAIRELFEESYFAEDVKDILGKVGDEERERILCDEPVRSLSPGYYARSEYLLDLGSSIECGIAYPPAALDRSDVLGLQAVKRARAEFERDHPSCGACGARQDNRFMNKCKRCQVSFGRSN